MIQELKLQIREKELAVANARTEDERQQLEHELELLNIRLDILYAA